MKKKIIESFDEETKRPKRFAHRSLAYLDSVDVSTRGKRRNAMVLVIELLEKIRNAEEQYMEKIPLNLQSGDAYYETECCVDAIIDAIDGLSDTY
jgi:hypothetical protein